MTMFSVSRMAAEVGQERGIAPLGWVPYPNIMSNTPILQLTDISLSLIATIQKYLYFLFIKSNTSNFPNVHTSFINECSTWIAEMKVVSCGIQLKCQTIFRKLLAESKKEIPISFQKEACIIITFLEEPHSWLLIYLL